MASERLPLSVDPSRLDRVGGSLTSVWAWLLAMLPVGGPRSWWSRQWW
jgi:hypothetical protein